MNHTLVIDIGNSRVKWAHAHARTLSACSAAAHAGDVGACLARAWATMPPPARVVLACVAGAPALAAAKTWIETHWRQTPQVVHARAAGYGIRNTYEDPAQLGADRWAALIGAWSLSAGAQCVIDCGTVVSLGVLNARGEFVGGALLPGLATARACLYARTPLPPAAGEATRTLARNTADAVAAGTLSAVVGGVERLLADYRAQVDADMRVVFTGGDAASVAAQFIATPNVYVVPELVLRGLARIAEEGA